MSQFTHKIEDLLENVAHTVHYTPDTQMDPSPQEPVDSSLDLSFPRILDFTFPQDSPDTRVSQVGEITYVGDGICHISGLSAAKIDEVVDIQTPKGIEKALILGVHENRVEAVVMGNYANIKRGDSARATNSRLRIPVGPQLEGRVIDALGQPLDGLGPIHSDTHRDVEFPAPGVVDRAPILEPIITGILNIDTTIPIGRGQRELVIGDRKTGKSRTMLDIISNQKSQNIHCIYVGVGMQAAKAKSTLNLLKSRGADKYTTMVISFSDDPPSLQYIAPYTGASLGEYYMYDGKHALIIYDDLSKQAKAYRQVSLLLKRSPGRDAYPGDIFFLHSRLLERASKLHPSLGGGSLTALPIAETQGGDISDYIITNLMSITDGHIFLDANMMHEGVLPAINSGASVSRIGGKVQVKLLQKVGELAGRILARYEEVKSFETINTEVTADTVRDIKRGKRIRDSFSQDSALAMDTCEEIVFLAIATSARMDHFTPDAVNQFKTNFIPFLRESQLLATYETTLLTSKTIDKIDSLLDSLFNRFCHLHHLPPIPTEATNGPK
jgi:F-type H+-transporting ATPase subunit alpha